MANQPERRSDYESRARPALQFSLTALFVLTTVFALALSALFGISQFFGVSVPELFLTGFGQFIYSVPRLIVWSVGLAMAVRRLRTHRKPAILTAVALAVLVVTILLVQTIQLAVFARISSGQVSGISISWIFAAIATVYSLIESVCWVLILMAIFCDRPVARSPFAAQTDMGDPFSQNEAIAAASIEEEAAGG